MKKLIKRTILTAVPVLFGAIMFTSVSASASKIIIDSTPGLDSEWAKQSEKEMKQALSPENIAKDQAQHRQYIKDAADETAVMKKLGMDPYGDYTTAQIQDQTRQIEAYIKQYGVPGSDDAKQKAAKSKKKLHKTNKKAHNKHIKDAKHKKVVKKQKHLRKYIKTTKSNPKKHSLR
ncbi:hypothetical protein [Apilactobacillus xinyiensis]|uniref:hypothetical protein n=1 Tax=Apilactobacillus xinyiensis TaxID=2841032 RepID=UPI001C7DE75F|nr:hypothetical protein [Apilactobacillus xinyiensis]